MDKFITGLFIGMGIYCTNEPFDAIFLVCGALLLLIDFIPDE